MSGSLTPRHLSPNPRRASREQLPGRDPDRELAALRADDLASDADPVAEREAAELLEVRGQCRQREQLDASGPVPKLGERELALWAGAHQSPGDGDRDAGLLAGFEVGVRTGHVARTRRRLETVPDLASHPPPTLVPRHVAVEHEAKPVQGEPRLVVLDHLREGRDEPAQARRWR